MLRGRGRAMHLSLKDEALRERLKNMDTALAVAHIAKNRVLIILCESARDQVLWEIEQERIAMALQSALITQEKNSGP